MIQSFWQTAFVKTSGDLEDPLEAWSETSIIVWKYNSTFYASRNMSTLMVMELRDNASAVIQNAAGNLSSIGGTVFVKTGTYYIDSTIYLNYSGVTVQGEGWGISGCGTWLILTTAGIPIFYIGGTAPAHTWFITVKDIELDGNHLAGTNGVKIGGDTYISDVWFQNVFFYQFGESGLKVQAHMYKVWNVWVRQCLLEENGLYGVYLTDATDVTTLNIDRVSVENCHFYGNLNSLRCDSPCVYDSTFSQNTVEQERQSSVNCTGGRSWKIQGNRIFDCGTETANTYGAVYVNGTGALGYGGNPESWVITDNQLQDQFAVHMNYSVWLTGNITDFQVKDNTFASLSTAYRGDGLTVYSSNIVVEGNSVAVPYEDASGYSYIVFTDGSSYFMRNGSTGRIDFSSTNASQVANFAVGNLTGTNKAGIVFVKDGTYEDVHITLGKSTRLIGESMYGVIFNVTTAGNCITLSSETAYAAGFSVENINIDMNEVAGHGIYSAHASNSGDWGGGRIENVYVDAVGVGKAGIYLMDPFRMVVRNVFIGTKGTGIYLGVDPALSVHYGNSLFEQITIYLLGNDTIGINAEADATYVLCLMEFNRIDLLVEYGLGYTNTTGMRLSGVQNSRFIMVNAEHVSLAFNLAPTEAVPQTQWNDFISCRAGDTVKCILLGNGAYDNNFAGGEYWSDAPDHYILWDDNGLASNFNKFTGVTFGQGVFELGLATKMYGCTINNKLMENIVLNVANTTATTFVFNHGLASTANSVQVSFNFTGWTSWTWTSTTTQVTVTITGTLPAAMKILAADVKYIP
jgi:hypothetical protein